MVRELACISGEYNHSESIVRVFTTHIKEGYFIGTMRACYNTTNRCLFAYASLSVPLQHNETGTFNTGILTEDKIFYVKVTRGNCPGNNTIVHIKVADATIVFVPSAFTPNGDGVNDIIKPVVQGLFTLEDFSIYDRFGHRVFKTSDITKGWKGDKNGSHLDTGTYIWIIKGKDINNKPLVQKGTIVLIH